jgi:hypothetical protein
MYNIKRLAYEINPPPEAALLPGSTDSQPHSTLAAAPAQAAAILDDGKIEDIVRRVLAELGQ